jgi:hypothetical protein|tara:strand:- start:6815 stop:7042 length:228 start_codon:yes stop_codon:yes gene_type:complete
MNMNKKRSINYLQKKAESDKEAALLAFELLLERPVGIGDHSTGDFTSNLDEALNSLVDANDRLETIDLLKGLYEI